MQKGKRQEIRVRSCRILIDEPGTIYRQGEFVVKQDHLGFGYDFTHLRFSAGAEGARTVRAAYLERKILQGWLQAARAGRLTRPIIRKLASCTDSDLRGASAHTLVRILRSLEDVTDTPPDKPGKLVLAPDISMVPKDMRKVLERLIYADEELE